MRKTTRLCCFLMILLLSFVFTVSATADYAKIDEDERFDPIFKSVPDDYYLCLDYYCITEFDEYKWMTEDEVTYFFLKKVGYIPYCYEEEDYVTYTMLHGELKLERRTNTEYGEPIYPDISVIPDEAWDVWSLEGFYNKEWYDSDEVFSLILPYIYQDYTFFITKDMSLFKFFINIEFDNETSYVYSPKKICVVSDNSGQLKTDDVMISARDLATMIYELYRNGPTFDQPDYYIFIPENVKLPEDPEDAYDEDEEEPTTEEPIEYEESPSEEAPVEETSESEDTPTEDAPTEDVPSEEPTVTEEDTSVSA